MRRKDYRGAQCVKRQLSKCKGICRTYEKLQTVLADMLQSDPQVVSFECNVPLQGFTESQYTTDFVAIKVDGSTMVRECVWRKNLSRPTTTKLLDLSRNYWLAQGVEEWGIVIEKEDDHERE